MTRNKALTPREAARRLGIRLDSVYSLVWAGKLAGQKRDGRWQITASSIETRLKQKGAHNG
jgi:excisionase family DNA binding protein